MVKIPKNHLKSGGNKCFILVEKKRKIKTKIPKTERKIVDDWLNQIQIAAKKLNIANFKIEVLRQHGEDMAPSLVPVYQPLSLARNFGSDKLLNNKLRISVKYSSVIRNFFGSQVSLRIKIAAASDSDSLEKLAQEIIDLYKKIYTESWAKFNFVFGAPRITTIK